MGQVGPELLKKFMPCNETPKGQNGDACYNRTKVRVGFLPSTLCLISARLRLELRHDEALKASSILVDLCHSLYTCIFASTASWWVYEQSTSGQPFQGIHCKVKQIAARACIGDVGAHLLSLRGAW
jgi:hypothetical protein